MPNPGIVSLPGTKAALIPDLAAFFCISPDEYFPLLRIRAKLARPD
jgi:hypothetical protein